MPGFWILEYQPVVLKLTAFWMNARISILGDRGIQSSVKTDWVIFIWYDCQMYFLELAIMLTVSCTRHTRLRTKCNDLNMKQVLTDQKKD